MELITHTQLMPGVHLTSIHTNKFKSSQFGVSLLAPLKKETAALYALLPMVLRRGCASYPDMASLSAALDDLYGGSVEPMSVKKGETQCVGFSASFLDDAYALEGEDILCAAWELLGKLLLEPYTCEGVFCSDYVDSERANLVDRIRGLINDKRQYSTYRLGQEMCRDEAWGISRLGEEQQALSITPESLWGCYEQLVKSAAVEIYYCGSAHPERVERSVRSAFAGLLCDGPRYQPSCQVVSRVGREPVLVEQSMDVTQGKLAMGFRTGGITVKSEEYPALMVFNGVFGGTSMSKLFMNVREKLSLCYFASSALSKIKGLMLVSSGIEFDKYDQARREILAQLEACRSGSITDDELEGAKQILTNSLHTILDSQARLADYWLEQRVAGLDRTPEQLAALLEQVTVEQVVRAAKAVELDTVYFLKGREAEA